MLYSIVRPLAKAALYVYFRKIYLSNADRIPKGKPVILACNHPTAFLEPCVLACFLDRPLYFLVRGDFFVNPFYARLLRALHMLPIYRWKDGGYSKLKDNFSTFDACFRALNENRTIMIFAEGNTKYEKRLRPLQRGPARIAFGALEQFPEMEDVYIVPLGVTYTQADRFRSEVMIDCGEPVRTREWLGMYREANQEGIASLTTAVESSMRRLLVHIEHPSDDMLVEYLLEIDRSRRLSALWPPFETRDEEPIRRERLLADNINALSEEEKHMLRQQTYEYFTRLEKHALEDRHLAPRLAREPASRLFLGLGLVPALMGYVLNHLPLWASRHLADEKVAHIEFYSPVMVASGIGFYLAYLILLLLIAGLAWGSEGILGVTGVPGLGLFTLVYLDSYERWRSERLIRQIGEAQLADLRARRERILSWLEQVGQPE